MRQKLFAICSSLMLLAVFSASFAAKPIPPTHPIQWQVWSPAVFEKAKKQHKLVFVYGKVEWCHWCQAMSSTTFQDPALIQEINAHYIPVKIDLEKEPQLADHYNVRDLPTMVVLDDRDRVLKKFFGFYQPGRLKEQLNKLVE